MTTVNPVSETLEETTTGKKVSQTVSQFFVLCWLFIAKYVAVVLKKDLEKKTKFLDGARFFAKRRFFGSLTPNLNLLPFKT